MYRLPEQVNASRYLARGRILLMTVIVIVLLMLPVVVIRAFHLNAQLIAARQEATDDQTWVVAQLEVEFLKLALAIKEIRPEKSDPAPDVLPPERWKDVMTRFDIFYSRVDTVANKIRVWSEGSDDWKRNIQLVDALILHRNLIADMMDKASTSGGQISLEALDTLMSATATDVRDLSVATLLNLTSQANKQRLHYISEQQSLLIQSVTMVFVMAVTSISALVLYRQIGMRAAAEHRLSENLYRVFDAKPDAILITDNDRRILWKNMAAAELFGVSVTKAPDVYPLDHYFPGIGRRARHGGRHPLDGTSTVDSDSTFRDIIRHALGGTRAVEVTQIRLMGESGHDTTALFVRDISKSQHALRALRRERGLAEAEAERYQRFLAVMSHEIRSPLHAILASLDLASQRPEAAALADLHGIALDAAQIALEEADAVLEIGRAEHEMRRAEPVVFSPVDILRDLVEMNGPSARAAETRMSVEIGPGAEGSVLGLRACFWHAVSNLVGNAVKFTKRGTIVLRLTRTDGTLLVEVADDGPGIAPDMQAAIFRDHYTRNPVPGGRAKGAGLGLGLVVAAVEAMSGQYGVQSTVGQGSTFWFTFPAAPAERQPQVPDLRGAVSLPTGLRVLVVDDAQVNRVLIQQMFSTLGLDADLAASGPEAVAMAEAYAYDLIMMDLSMPDMDGFAAAAAIRRGGASKRSAIVALTANVLARQEVDKPDSDFDGMLLKPLRLDELRHALAAGLHRPSQSRVREAPLVDMSVADDLLKMLPPAAIEPLLTALLDEARDLARDLDQGVPVQGLPARFHRIAGSAGMLGAERLRGLALDAELDCKESARAPTLSFRAAWTQTIAETAREWSSHLAEIAHPVGATFER